MQEKVIDRREAGQRLDKFAGKYLDKAPKSFIYKMLRKKNITVNGTKAEGALILAEKDVVRFFLSDETIAAFRSRPAAPAVYDGPAPAILFENDDFIILNKPPGLLSQGDRSGRPSAVDFLRDYLMRTQSLTEEDMTVCRPSPCHRLDRNTSGILLCGKTLKGLQHGAELIRTRAVGKYYLTLVHGNLKKSGTLIAWGRKRESDNTLIVRGEAGKGYERMETRYRSLETCEGLSLLMVELVTGKPHQIRAHLAFEGHPVVGDRKYGTPEAWPDSDRRLRINRQMLHAYRLVFPEDCQNPRALAGKGIDAPLPEDMRSVLKKTGFRTDCYDLDPILEKQALEKESIYESQKRRQTRLS